MGAVEEGRGPPRRAIWRPARGSDCGHRFRCAQACARRHHLRPSALERDQVRRRGHRAGPLRARRVAG
ncbi:hypothetical protein M885DRAFT_504923, partial [Pelagophyceae sp. CCMP2097]